MIRSPEQSAPLAALGRRDQSKRPQRPIATRIEAQLIKRPAEPKLEVSRYVRAGIVHGQPAAGKLCRRQYRWFEAWRVGVRLRPEELRLALDRLLQCLPRPTTIARSRGWRRTVHSSARSSSASVGVGPESIEPLTCAVVSDPDQLRRELSSFSILPSGRPQPEEGSEATSALVRRLLLPRAVRPGASAAPASESSTRGTIAASPRPRSLPHFAKLRWF
eukprot:scaffold62036_cov32-Tisochrysis_lutea.AAC.4